jgi:hypothetical protein
VDLESNLAFSPLGYSALLAILAEGARGDTRNQLANALHLPENPEVTRDAYKTALERLHVSNNLHIVGVKTTELLSKIKSSGPRVCEEDVLLDSHVYTLDIFHPIV